MNAPIVPPYAHVDLFPLGPDTTSYRKLTSDFVHVERFRGRDVLVVEPEGLKLLRRGGVRRYQSPVAAGHLQQLANILADRKRRQTTSSSPTIS